MKNERKKGEMTRKRRLQIKIMNDVKGIKKRKNKRTLEKKGKGGI